MGGELRAQNHSSSNFTIREYGFGAGGDIDVSSSNFGLRATIGDVAIGNAASSNFQVYAGFTTTDDEFLELSVTSQDTDLGVLSTGAETTATGAFSVRAYVAHGYDVRTESDPPTSFTNTIEPLAAGGASSPGTEQFGINLKDNSAPDVGAEASQVPDSSFSFGAAATGYDTVNSFRYNKGEVIARSTKSSGQTDYTISYLYNIDNSTEAGQYSFNHIIVATGRY